VLIPRHLARTIGLWLPLEQLRVDTVAFDKSVDVVTAETTAFVALDGNNVELADNVAEYDRAVARHHSHPSTRNARSILRRCRLNVSPFSCLCGHTDSRPIQTPTAAQAQAARSSDGSSPTHPTTGTSIDVRQETHQQWIAPAVADPFANGGHFVVS
jgi:hypothetical protein